MASKLKTIEAIIAPPAPHMVGDAFRVHNFFPSSDLIGMQGMSPFYLLDYNSKIEVPPSLHPRGVSVHPHRGFEAVTIVYHGVIAHHDSAGNSGVIREGDVQWMTAGWGVLHKEYLEAGFSKKGGPLQMLQLWVNLPAKFKMSPPKYQGIKNDLLVKYKLADKKSIVEIIAGSYKGLEGSAKTFTPVNLFNAKLAKDSKADFSFSKKHNSGILILEGKVKINELTVVPRDSFVFFKHDGEIIFLEALEDSMSLILSGAPIEEPIASYGPFLMNTDEEIQEAFDDYYSGKFGYLAD